MMRTTLDAAAPTRCRTVSCGAGDFTVPKHVVRLESDRLAGWQVRWETSRYFADGLHGRPEASLTAAIRHLRKVWKPTLKKTQRGQSASSKTPGVGLYRDARTGAIYVEARHPNGGRPVRFYAGTPNTVTPARLTAATRKAKKARAEILAANPVPLR